MKVNRLVIRTEEELNSTRDRMFHEAKDGKSFFGLVELMKNKQAIITAIHNIKSNKGSYTPGIDNKDIDHILQLDEEYLISLVLHSVDNYEPTPVRRVYIPKTNGKERPLGIPTMIDRIIQELARLILEPIAEAKFYHHSYGFRPYRSAEHALARVRDLICKSKTYFAIEGDIQAFFDNVNHNKLIETLWTMGVKDKRYLAIIKKMLEAGYMEKGNLFSTDVGTPQGGIISPLLANIYLNHFDWMIANEYEYHSHTNRYTRRDSAYDRLMKRGHQPTFLVRYADDWIILTKTEENAKRILEKIDKYFSHRLKIRLSPEKTLITDLRVRPAKFLGYCLKADKPRKSDKITGILYPDMKKLGNKIRDISRDVKRLRYLHDMEWAAVNIEKINAKIVGLANYFNKGISKRALQKIDNRLFWKMAVSMKWLYGCEKINQVFIKAYDSIDSFNNRKFRHSGYLTKSFFVEFDGLRIGLTLASITPVAYSRNFNRKWTPYTIVGRNLWRQVSCLQVFPFRY
ncbi:group II intron reverse transcriptase/maturase [Paenibacillus periandrae]|uniref:group II intron reverse transcriptase/maturase n=1 Tax=Paenibacillus periandrae TaxID=1761741 RepID=UPI001F08AE33|nr:group II intron reverse transcriptase/maturase [Paenibacillus periandrae]